ncbi:MAG: methylated-DNA--[protein]-cysteine S-methyltransferase [Ruminococcaceae bacterium]|jgi:methylated-DNA-[protein]-cysteine S-methyltransferase|nr:methylated-DNA--[protein]-cysteine S-methyltransferase [Oscillospiraceae bacterium]
MNELTIFAAVPSPLGTLYLCEEDGALSRISCDCPDGTEGTSPLLREAAKQLDEYFLGERKDFDLPLAAHGTPFQMRVWQALRAIPYGETRTYAQIAAAAGSPKAFRAVGQANHVNPLMIVVPCHRVVGADGSLTGYAYGMENKKKLLALEKAHR